MPQTIPTNRQELLNALNQIQGQGATLDERRAFVKEVKAFRPNVDFSEPIEEEEEPGRAKKIARGAGEIAKGAAKRAVQIPLAGSELIQKGLRAITQPITGEQPEIGEVSQVEILQREGGLQKAGAVATDIASLAIPLGATARLGTGIAAKAITQATVAGATTAASEGKIGPEAAISAGIAGAFPIVGGVFKKSLGALFGKSKLIQSATGLTRTVASKADDVAQSNIRVGGKVQKAYNSIDDFLVDEGFFAKGMQTTRGDMLQHADDLLATAKASKKEVLSDITAKISSKRVPDFKKLTTQLKDAYKGILGQEQAFKRINEIAAKKSLTAVDLDDLRRLADDLLPRGAFSGAEPIKVKGLEKTIAPLRKLISGLDQTGAIQRDNVRIRVLSQLLGIGKQSNPLKIAAEKDPGFNIARDLIIGGAAGGSAALIPGGQVVAPLIAGAGIAKAVTENPSVASGLVNLLTKFTGKTITPDIIQNILRAAAIEGGSLVGAEDSPDNE